jgi:hypothetical protein
VYYEEELGRRTAANLMTKDEGLIAAAGALNAACIVWTAVQQQINAEKERTTADRQKAETPRQLRGE